MKPFWMLQSLLKSVACPVSGFTSAALPRKQVNVGFCARGLREPMALHQEIWGGPRIELHQLVFVPSILKEGPATPREVPIGPVCQEVPILLAVADSFDGPGYDPSFAQFRVFGFSS